MLHRTVTVGSASGLHARPASVFTKAATQSGLRVLIGRPGAEQVDATSILSVMGLGVNQGDEVVLSSPDESAGDSLDELAVLLATNLDA